MYTDSDVEVNIGDDCACRTSLVSNFQTARWTIISIILIEASSEIALVVFSAWFNMAAGSADQPVSKSLI